MRAWPGLLVAPSTALAHLSVVFALSTPSCERQSQALLHGVSALALLIALACTAMAALAWRRAPQAATDSAERQRFMATVATGVGALSTVVIIALWLPPWWLSPCWS
jgi:uncharacterized membrane protein YidH (DUF202 family)